MADDTVINRYQQYKRGTAKLVNWLANTARDCEDVSAIVPSIRAARDAAKQSKRKQKRVEAPVDTKVMLTASQLVSLARVVAKAAVKIPDDIVRTTKAVIAGRQVSADWHSSCTSSADSIKEEQNRTHQHFIGTLQDILHILQTSKGYSASKSSKPSRRQQQQQHDTPKKTKDGEDLTANLFSYLDIDQPTEDPLGSAPVSKHATSKPGTCKVQFELNDPEGDKNFAIWCFLQDMRELRQEIRTLWISYRDGKMSFSAVAEMSANAINIMSLAEVEFIRQYTDLCAYQKILNHLGLEIGALGATVWVSPAGDRDVKDISSGRVCGNAVVDLICPRAFILTLEFVLALSKRLGNIPQAPDDAKRPYLKIHPFGQALWGLLPHLTLEKLRGMHGMQQDIFLAGVFDIEKSPGRRPGTWLIMACQVQMDIHEIMGSDFSSGIEDFQARLKADMATLRKFSASIWVPDATKKHADLAQRFKIATEQTSRLIKDPLHDAALHPRGPTEQEQTSLQPSFKIYKVFPIVPGLLINASAATLHSLGIALGNYYRVVLSVAYLYRAVFKVNAMQLQWEEMDFVINAQSRKKPFILESNTDGVSMSRCFCLALGVKLHEFAKGKRGRPLKLPTDTYINEHGKELENFPVTSGIINCKANDLMQKTAGLLKMDVAVRSLDQLQDMNLKGGALRDIYQQYKANGKLTLVQLSIALTEIFLLEEMNLKFDYLGFYVNCERMLCTILWACEPSLRELRSKTEFDLGIPYDLVSAILSDATGQATSFSVSKTNMLQEIGRAMVMLTKNDGGALHKLAKEQTSGHLLCCPANKSKLQSRAMETDEYAADAHPTHSIRELLQVLGLDSDGTNPADNKFYSSRQTTDVRVEAQEAFAKMIKGGNGHIEKCIQAFRRYMDTLDAEVNPEQYAKAGKQFDEVCNLVRAKGSLEA